MHIGGAEKLLTQLAPMMNKNGNQCDVALFDGTDTQFRQALVEAGVHVIDFTQGGSVYNPFHIFRLLKLMRQYDIVHTHNTAPQLFTAIASVLCSVILCTTEHNTSNRRRNWKWYAIVDKWMYSRYKTVISISPATTTNLIKHTKIKCPILTISNGIDVDSYKNALPLQRDIFGFMEENVIITQVAGFRYQKDQVTVIKSLQYLPKNYVVLFVGDGERRGECESLVKKLGLEGRVHFAGLRSDVNRVLKMSDIVVMSSHWEGFGLAAVEGMAAGKPVIATNISGLAEVVKGAGLLFEHEDSKGLADSIKNLHDDKSLCDKIVASSQIRAEEYDIKQMARNYLDVYNKFK